MLIFEIRFYRTVTENMLAYITSKGRVGDYIKIYLDETDASEKVPSWNDFKESLKNYRSPARDSINAQDAAKLILEGVQLFKAI